MSLRVWLPLTKDLRNQGLDDVAVTNNGATFNSAGKLGGCYSFNRSSSNYLKIDNPITTATNGVSMAFWVKIPSNASGNNQIVHIGNGPGWNNNRCTCFIYQGSSSLIFSCSDGQGTGTANSTQYSCKSSTLTLNNWIHVACTYSTGKMKIYLNGVLDKDYTTTIIPSFANTSYIGVGAAPNAGEPATVYVNDIRIYDHCLSEMEIKQLSQGLVLHYPLNRNGWGQENLLKNSYGTIIDKTGNAINSRTEYFAWNVGSNYTDITTATTVTISFDLQMYISDLTTYNGQLLIYNTNNKGPVQIEGVGYVFKNKYTIGDTINERVSLTTRLIPRIDATQTNNFIEFYTGYGSNNFYKISNVKLELGEITTPWCPNSSDTLATTMGLNSTTEYDCSGFCNNGTWHGTYTNTSDTPKYAVSTTATGSSTTYLEGPVLPAEAKTVALWIKNTSKSSNGAIFNDKTTGLQIGLLNSLLYMNSKASTAGFTTTHWVNGEWNHVVAVNNNGTRSLYVNGQPETQSGASNYYIHNADNCWLWNRSYNNNYPFNGSLSDLRVYATALSASDVKSLYQNCATIDPDGTIRGQIRS